MGTCLQEFVTLVILNMVYEHVTRDIYDNTNQYLNRGGKNTTVSVLRTFSNLPKF